MNLSLITRTGLVVLAGIALVTPAFAAATTTDTFGSGGNLFTMDFVNVGNPGNGPDSSMYTNLDQGSVDYTYRMGSYEVSEDMINKANSAGSLGITKDTRGANKPATSITWFEAARFVNYLNVTSGYAPAYKFSVQPGESGYSVNSPNLIWSSLDAGYDLNNLFRNSNAKYFLPSEDEWYKAAYYSGTGTYYLYPTGSDTPPTAVASGTAEGTAVSYGPATGPADVTSAGGLSPYGTMGQGGNAFEWMETQFHAPNNSPSEARVQRGGSWYFVLTGMRSVARGDLNDPFWGNDTAGFRVASIPEPSGLALTMLFSGMMLIRRRR